jgi:ABC-2 type transport system permease protein
MASWRHIGIVAAWEFRRRVLSRAFWLSTLLLPLIPLLIGGLVVLASLFTRPTGEGWHGVALYDETGRLRSVPLPQGLRYATEPSAWQSWWNELQQDRLRWLIRVADSTFQQGHLFVYGRRGEFPRQLRRELERLLLSQLLTSFRLDSATQRLLFSGFRWNLQWVDSAGEHHRAASGAITAFIVAVLLFGLLMAYGGTLTDSVAEEKEDRLAELLLGAVRPRELLWGKVLGLGGLGIFQQLCWAMLLALFVSLLAVPLLQQNLTELFAGSSAADGPAGANLEAVQHTVAEFGRKAFGVALLCFGLGYLFYAGLFAIAGALSPTRSQSGGLMLALVSPLLIPIIVLPMLLENPDSPMGTVLTLLPFSAPVVAPLRILAGGIPVWEAIAAFGGLIAATVGIFWLAGKLYRVGMLHLGGIPQWRQLWQWLQRAD